jgi:hypothetical protein
MRPIGLVPRMDRHRGPSVRSLSAGLDLFPRVLFNALRPPDRSPRQSWLCPRGRQTANTGDSTPKTSMLPTAAILSITSPDGASVMLSAKVRGSDPRSRSPRPQLCGHAERYEFACRAAERDRRTHGAAFRCRLDVGQSAGQLLPPSSLSGKILVCPSPRAHCARGYFPGREGTMTKLAHMGGMVPRYEGRQ